MVMAALAVGLVLFLALHSLRIVASGWRDRLIETIGEGPWKGLYSLGSVLGLGLTIFGFASASGQPPLWQPPIFLRHVSALLMVFAFVLLTATYLPRNRLKPLVGHPMVLAVKVWAFAHLLSNGRPRDLLLFGAFLVWAIVDYASLRRRDCATGVRPDSSGSLRGDAITLCLGVIAWGVFAFVLHQWIIGINPLG